MNEVTIFKNEEFGEVRTIEIDNECWFVAKDVAIALGYSDTKQAIEKNIEKEDKISIQNIGGINTTLHPQTIIINESGLYALIFSSKLESAKGFKHWVTSEVLPSIRKTGSYTIPNKKSDRELAIEEEKLRLEKAKIWREIGLDAETQSKTYKQICNAYATKSLEGTFVLPLPEVRKSYSAEEIGKQLGISATKVGRIANHYNLKTENLGCWQKDKAKYDSSKEVDSWRYYEESIPLIAEHKDEKISNR
ncbi:MAG: hypothetical protein KBT03_03185 [Bacteroidales bacterium]|nr:hypothetical protein [Candidatus Scybalousia scybalohippi]